MSDPFEGVPRAHFGVILADPPWHFQAWAGGRFNGDEHPIYTPARAPDYTTMREGQLAALPIEAFAAKDCVLFLWTTWPVLEQALRLIPLWGFKFKTCAFSWLKADPYKLWMAEEDIRMGLGYWTRANTEPCLLATRGKPKRRHADVRQGIVEKAREHSRKPDCVHERIERLVAGPYLELFARQSRPGWTTWGLERTKFDQQLDAAE